MKEYFYLVFAAQHFAGMQRQRLHNARKSVIIKFVLSLHQSEVQTKGARFEKKKYDKLLNKESTSN